MSNNLAKPSSPSTTHGASTWCHVLMSCSVSASESSSLPSAWIVLRASSAMHENTADATLDKCFLQELEHSSSEACDNGEGVPQSSELAQQLNASETSINISEENWPNLKHLLTKKRLVTRTCHLPLTQSPDPHNGLMFLLRQTDHRQLPQWFVAHEGPVFLL